MSSGRQREAEAGYWTWTLLYPSDPGDPRWDGGGSGPIIVAEA